MSADGIGLATIRSSVFGSFDDDELLDEAVLDEEGEEELPPNGLPFIVASACLFYIGVAFAFFLVLPLVFDFFANTAPAGVKVMTDINSFLSFTIGMVFAFGLAFQVPIVVIIIAWTGLVSRRALKSARPYVFLAVFVIAAVLTPPDVFSQTLLALPMYVLYEIALLACARFLPDRD